MSGVGRASCTQRHTWGILLSQVYTKGSLDLEKAKIVQYDAIFQALRRKRTIQPFGGLKKVKEDIDEELLTNALTVEDGDEKTTYEWHRDRAIYIGKITGKILADWNPPRKVLALLGRLKHHRGVLVWLITSPSATPQKWLLNLLFNPF